MPVIRPSCSMCASTLRRSASILRQFSLNKMNGLYVEARRYSSEPPPHKTPTGIMGRYERFLKIRAPRAYAVHKMVVDGSKWCVTDIKTYYKLRRDLSNGTRNLSQLTQNELEILIQTSEEIAKMIIVIILIPLPMTFYFLGAALVFFPRLVLTRHFWTNDQRKDFWASSMKRSANLHFRPIRDRLKKMKIKIPASIEDLRSLKAPRIETLPFMHLYHLARIHHIIPFMGVRHLYRRAEELRQLDHFLSRSEAVDAMSDQQLYLQLYLRRLQYHGMTIDEMRAFLKKWIRYSSASDLSTSAYLHAPAVFFQHKANHHALQ